MTFDCKIALLLGLLLAGCSAAAPATPVEATASVTAALEATLSPPTTDRAALAAEIEANWTEVDSLARPHLDMGLDCEDCHVDGVEGTWPPSELCLDCHETSYSELYEILDESGEPVHPAAHLETEDCRSCHWPHDNVRDPCQACH